MNNTAECKKPKEEFIAREVDFPDIAQQIKKKIISERSKNYACNSLWASEAGHDCERYLVYQQCDWDKAKPVDDNLLLVFNEGNLQEDQLLLELQKAGIKVKDLQIGIKIQVANITGKLDCVAEIEDTAGHLSCLPIEIKSMSDNVYNNVNTVADFEKYPWTRKYYGQMQTYLKNDNWFYPYGYFLAKNKSTGAIKLIKDYDGSNAIKFNEEYWNFLVNRGKKISKFVFNNKKIQMEISSTDDPQEIEDLTAQLTYPERIKYDIKVCQGCKYEHICIADLSDITGSQITNESVIKAIEEYIEAEKNRGKYKSVEKEYQNSLSCLKKIFPLEDKIYMTENYLIEAKVKKGSKSEYLTFSISNLDKKKE